MMILSYAQGLLTMSSSIYSNQYPQQQQQQYPQSQQQQQQQQQQTPPSPRNSKILRFDSDPDNISINDSQFLNTATVLESASPQSIVLDSLQSTFQAILPNRIIETSASSASATVEQQDIARTKNRLKVMLRRSEGNITPNVMRVIDRLTHLHLKQETSEQELSQQFVGNFRTLTAPTFPGRTDDEGSSANLRTQQQQKALKGKYFSLTKTSNRQRQQQRNMLLSSCLLPAVAASKKIVPQYTLGRMSFNIFQPNDLVCSLVGIRNQVVPHDKESSETSLQNQKYAYNVISDIVIHTENGVDLPALLRNDAICVPESSDKLSVRFVGGTLIPSSETVRNPSKLEAWQTVFAGAYGIADSQKSGWDALVWNAVKLAFGLSLPNDDRTVKTAKFIGGTANDAGRINNSFHFRMKRSPVGFMEVLFIDETMRITRGNRGTIVVVERMPQKMKTRR